MSHTVTEHECNKCNEKYNGALDDILLPERQYYVECPKCENHTFFYGVSSLVNLEVPDDAVKIKYVAKL